MVGMNPLISVCGTMTMVMLITVHHSGATTGGNGGSRLRAPLERGHRVQTAMFFFILFNYKILSRFVAANDTPSFDTFKKHLKSYLFLLSFSSL